MSIQLAPRQSPRAFGIIPAAGASRRMGVDKLLLPWGKGLLIDAVIANWQNAVLDAIVVVVNPLHTALLEHCRKLNVDVVAPDRPPPEMKDSVASALSYLERTYHPTGDDVWLVAPADVPGIATNVIRQVVQTARDHASAIVIPVNGEARGHPALFSWRLAIEVQTLKPDEGINALFQRHTIDFVECGPAATPPDVDTPDDYRRLTQLQSE